LGVTIGATIIFFVAIILFFIICEVKIF